MGRWIRGAALASSSLALLGTACGEPLPEEDAPLGQSSAALYAQNQGTRNGVVLWRGFNHWWEYNHRVNRLGDWVQNDGCTGETCSARVIHAAASGSGPDTASYKSWYTTLATSAAAFRTGSRAIDIKGSRGVQHDVTTTVAFLPDEELSNRSRHKVVLNGFDIESGNDADKLKRFGVSVSNARDDGGILKFDVDATLQMNCTSLECEEDDVDYRILVHYVYIAGDEDFTYRSWIASHSYSWDTSTEETLSPSHEFSRTASGAPGYAAATMAYTSILVDLNAQQHLLAWTMGMPYPSGAYDSATGQLSYDENMFFKNWADGMGWTHVPYSNFAYRESGSASLSSTKTLLQFKTGTATHGYVTGTFNYDPSESFPMETRNHALSLTQ
jgi:hypothetical protein